MKKIPLPAFLSILAIGFASTASLFSAEPPPPPKEVVKIEHTDVEAAFAQGRPILSNNSYKIQAGRRVAAPGQVEVHEHDTDIFYVQEGTATFVTGGTVEESKTTGAGEIRGKAIVGGTKHTLQKGDMIVVPAGTPHWFTELSNPFLYLVVKVTK
jgi:quercetin dioxygenase-like cupin family protein